MIAGYRPFYKYVVPTTALTMLDTGQARYSTPLLFNDPFDTQSGLHFDFDTATLHESVVDRIVELASLSTEPEVDKNDFWGKVVLEVRRNYTKTGFNKERWMQLNHQSFAALLETIHKTRNDYERHWQEVQLPQMRVFCVSEDKDNLLMWAHYAQDHKGAVRSGSVDLNKLTPIDKCHGVGLKGCRVVHGGGRRLATNDRRGGQLGAHRRFHFMQPLVKPASSIAKPALAFCHQDLNDHVHCCTS